MMLRDSMRRDETVVKSKKIQIRKSHGMGSTVTATSTNHQLRSMFLLDTPSSSTSASVLSQIHRSLSDKCQWRELTIALSIHHPCETMRKYRIQVLGCQQSLAADPSCVRYEIGTPVRLPYGGAVMMISRR